MSLRWRQGNVDTEDWSIKLKTKSLGGRPGKKWGLQKVGNRSDPRANPRLDDEVQQTAPSGTNLERAILRKCKGQK